MAGTALGSGPVRKSSRLITEINITPLVDVMLVLLIIFMVTTSYIVRESLEVSLPEAASGAPHSVSLLALTLDKNGQLALNGEKTSEQDVAAFITAQAAQGVTLEAVIAADKDVPHGTVVGLIDLVRRHGVVKFAINVLRPET